MAADNGYRVLWTVEVQRQDEEGIWEQVETASADTAREAVALLSRYLVFRLERLRDEDAALSAAWGALVEDPAANG